MNVNRKVSEGPFTVDTVATKDGVADTTIENIQHGYDTADSGVLTSSDGSSTITPVEGLPLQFQVTPLRPSARDGEGNYVPSKIQSALDADTRPGQVAMLSVDLFVTVIEEDEVVADTLTHVIN